MRARVYHRHRVSRTSALLNGLLMMSVFFSLCFTAPVMLTYVGIKWNRFTKTESVWMLLVFFLWFSFEVARLLFGFSGNKRMLPAYHFAFLLLTLSQFVFMVIYFMMVPERRDLEYSIYVTQMLLLGLETLAGVRLLWRLMRNNTINFYVALGAPV